MGQFGFFAIQGILLARFLGPDNRGAFAAASLYPQALLYLGLLGAPELFAGYASRSNLDASLRRSALRYGLFSGFVTAAICMFLAWSSLPPALRWVMPWAALCALTVPLQHVRLAVQAVDHGQRQFTRYNAVRLTAAAAFPLALVVGWLVGKTDFQSTCWLFVAAQLFSMLLVQFGMSEPWFGTSELPIGKALSDARGLIGAWLSAELLERIDMVLVLLIATDQQTLGFYAAAVPIASVMIILPNTAGLYAFNRGTSSKQTLTVAEVWRMVSLGLGLQFLTAGMLAALLPWIVPILFGKSFEPTIAFAWALLPAGVFRGLIQTCDSYLRARQRPMAGVKARAVAVPILLLFCWFAVKPLGAMAVPLGLSLAQAICFAIMLRAVLMDVTSSTEPSSSNSPISSTSTSNSTVAG